MSKATLKTPGISVAFANSGSYLYATIKHTNTNLNILHFTKAPLPMGKKEFCRLVDEHLSCMDWNAIADVDFLLVPSNIKPYLEPTQALHLAVTNWVKP